MYAPHFTKMLVFSCIISFGRQFFCLAAFLCRFQTFLQTLKKYFRNWLNLLQRVLHPSLCSLQLSVRLIGDIHKMQFHVYDVLCFVFNYYKNQVIWKRNFWELYKGKYHCKLMTTSKGIWEATILSLKTLHI